MADNLAHPYNRRRVLTINDLPDDDLLAIFDFYVVRYQDPDLTFDDIKMTMKMESWQSLVHVCRRWRGLVFASPRRLNLKLCYASETSARRTLDIWPALPLVVKGFVHETSEDIIAVLKQSDRICQINFACISIRSTEKFLTAMEVPFPELAVLKLRGSLDGAGPELPDSFLGGSAPRLRHLILAFIPFPGLLKLLLSATRLVHLSLSNIPHSGCISPEAMATCLSMLTSLEELHFDFNFLVWESRRSPLPTRYFLPALTRFQFHGNKIYLEDLVSRIDAPRLYQLSTKFFPDVDFDIPELIQFISRTPTFEANNEAHLMFIFRAARVRLQSHHGMVEVQIPQEPEWLLSNLAPICASSSCLLLTTEDLYIDWDESISLHWPDDILKTDWLDLLLPFTAVKNLYLSKPILRSIAPALQELTGERTTEVLPTLKNILLEGLHPSEPVQEGIAQFISARQLTNHPVALFLLQ